MPLLDELVSSIDILLDNIKELDTTIYKFSKLYKTDTTYSVSALKDIMLNEQTNLNSLYANIWSKTYTQTPIDLNRATLTNCQLLFTLCFNIMDSKSINEDHACHTVTIPNNYHNAGNDIVLNATNLGYDIVTPVFDLVNKKATIYPGIVQSNIVINYSNLGYSAILPIYNHSNNSATLYPGVLNNTLVISLSLLGIPEPNPSPIAAGLPMLSMNIEYVAKKIGYIYPILYYKKLWSSAAPDICSLLLNDRIILINGYAQLSPISLVSVSSIIPVLVKPGDHFLLQTTGHIVSAIYCDHGVVEL